MTTMSRPKLNVEKVYLLTEQIPYEANIVLDVYATSASAQAAQPDVKRWYPGTDPSTGLNTWSSRRPGQRSTTPAYIITERAVRPR